MSSTWWPLLVICALYSLQLSASKYHSGLHQEREPQPLLPEDHPKLAIHGALGLPTGCLTYTERYSRAKNFTHRQQKGWNPNAAHPRSKYVVLVRVHNGLPYPTDLVLHLRSLMEEVHDVGMHFWLLYQEDRPPGDFGSIDIPAEAAHMDLALPEELIPVTHAFSQEQVHKAYPLVHSFEPHIRDYLPAVYFLNTHKNYEFGWILEWDVRYTGPHWGHLFNSVLHLASSQLSSVPLTAQEQKAVGQNAALPAAEQELPDLIAFAEFAISGPVHEDTWGPDDPPWVPRDREHWNFTDLTKCGLMEMGLSRRLMDRLHDLSGQGIAGYLEELIPTATAAQQDLEFVVVPVPQYDGASNHCCQDVARDLYRDWYRSRECRAPALLHPVKLFTADHRDHKHGEAHIKRGHTLRRALTERLHL